MDWTSLLSMANVAALIVTGTWVVFKYLSFQREQDKLGNRIQHLETEYREQPRLESGLKVRVASDEEMQNGIHRYVLEVEFRIKNLSKKAVDVTATTIDFSLGKLTPEASSNECVFAWNPPPGVMNEEILNADTSNFPLLWEKLGDQSAIYRLKGKQALELPLLEKHLKTRRISIGGWATGTIREGEDKYINFDLQLTTPRHRWIGVAVAIFLDECCNEGDLVYERFWSELGRLSKQSIHEK